MQSVLSARVLQDDKMEAVAHLMTSVCVEMYISNHGYIDGKEERNVSNFSFVLFTLLVNSLPLVRRFVFW